MNYISAKAIADEVKARLAPFCERIEIAGSIRRQKMTDIHDIEIVAITKRPRLEFGASPLPPLIVETDRLRAEGIMTPRLDKLGREAWGQKFRRASWGGTPLDLFMVSPETWGVIYTIRTGNADFSHLLVTPHGMGGAMPDGCFIKDGRLWMRGELIETREEADVFAALGLTWIEPQYRTLEALRNLVTQ
jgi:DNA polymerase/3'-5' exonuclease PolX